LSIFVDENPDKVPISALRYLIGECNYGGRVTEELDRRTLMVLMGEYFNESMYDDDYRFSPSGIYYAPKHGDYESYIKYA
jgi:dynein heavy chain